MGAVQRRSKLREVHTIVVLEGRDALIEAIVDTGHRGGLSSKRWRSHRLVSRSCLSSPSEARQ